jgi:gliding motility-associated-like protein
VTGRQFDPSVSPETKQYEGKYMMKFEYTNPLTGCTSSDSQSLLVQSNPEIVINSPNPYQQCEGQPFDLNATKNWAKASIWNSNGDGRFNDSSLLITKYNHGIKRDTAVDELNGKIQLYLSTLKEGVCPVAIDTLNLIIESYPQFDFMADPEIQCEPAIVNFVANVSKPFASPNLRYSWTFGNGESLDLSTVSSPQNIKYDTAKRSWYDVVLRVDNKWGINDDQTCSTTKDSLGYIKVLPQPKAGFSSNPGYRTTVAFPRFKFQNETFIRWSNPGTLSYVWYFGTGDIEDTSWSEHPVYAYPADTNVYRVHLSSIYAYPYKSVQYECVDTISEPREIDPDVTVFVPTAFSPERTGPKANNIFKAVVNGEKTFHIELYNRWGELLWKTDDKMAGWDGTFMGEDVQQDVYTWVIKVTAFDGEEYTYEGTVTLMR